MTSQTVVMLVAVGAALWLARAAALPAAFAGRRCQGFAWRRAFPTAGNDDLRAFLAMFVDAFALRMGDRLKFSPDDTILGVYRARYRHRWQADALELETLAASMQRRYGLAVRAVWSEDLTLGQLFAMTRSALPRCP